MFVKFPEIERFELLSDEKKELFKHPAEEHARSVVVTEKIDGSHITVWIPFYKDQAIEIYSRNGKEFNQGDFNVTCKDKLVEDCNKFREVYKVDEEGNFIDEEPGLLGISLDGEVYGRRIMNRLPYPEKSKVVFYRGTSVFSDESENRVWSKHELNCYLNSYGMEDYVLPVLKDALFVDCDVDYEELFEELPLPFNSKYTVEESKAEGYVIDFYDRDADGYHWLGCIKRKDDDFYDMKTKSNISQEDYAYALSIQKEFEGYALNENRILDAYGKGYKKLSELIPEVLCDAKKDFMKTRDNDMLEILKNNKQLNKVAFNLGSKLFVMAKRVLKNHFGIEY